MKWIENRQKQQGHSNYACIYGKKLDMKNMVLKVQCNIPWQVFNIHNFIGHDNQNGVCPLLDQRSI